MKKILLLAGAALGLSLSLTALAAPPASDPTLKAGMMTNATYSGVQQSPTNYQRLQDYNSYLMALQQGTLAADQQKALYQLLTLNSWSSTGAASMMQGGNTAYKVMLATPDKVVAASFNGRLTGWLGLMVVLTVAMVWVVLLLLIGVLWHHMAKHKAHK